MARNGRRFGISGGRRITGAIVAVFLASSAMAQTATPAGTWDPSDPQNIVDRHEFIVRYWNGMDSGDMVTAMQGMHFTNQPLNRLSFFFYEAYALFENIYAHRLYSAPLTDPPYSIQDLIWEDPLLLAKFREYTLTGTLATAIVDDPTAVSNHVDAVLTAVAGEPGNSLSGEVSLVGDTVVSNGLTTNSTATGWVVDWNVPEPSPGTTRDILRCLIDQSLIKCLSDSGLAWPSYGPNFPDFDCDDFDRAMLAWLHNRLKAYPEAIRNSLRYMYSVPLFYKCKVGTNPDDTPKWVDNGHAVSLVLDCSNDPCVYWVIDAQTGRLLGPYPYPSDPNMPAEDLRKFWKEFRKKIIDDLEPNYGCHANEREIVDPPRDYEKPDWDYPPTPPGEERKKDIENPAWWHDRELGPSDPRWNDVEKDMWKRFKDKLAACCATHPPANCPTTPGLAPTPCEDPEPYIWKP